MGKTNKQKKQALKWFTEFSFLILELQQLAEYLISWLGEN